MIIMWLKLILLLVALSLFYVVFWKTYCKVYMKMFNEKPAIVEFWDWLVEFCKKGP